MTQQTVWWDQPGGTTETEARPETVAPRAVDPVAPVAPPSPRRRPAPGRGLVALPLLAVAAWVLGFLGADPRRMSDLGLVSLLSPAAVAALVVLCVGMLLALHWNVAEWLLGLHLVVFLALVHGTPAVLYGTVRYAWSYKHLGIVDYIQRTGTLDPEIAVGGIYHNWPGFFAGSALLTDAAGRVDAQLLALWSPLAFNLLNLLVLRYVFRGLTRNTRLVWLGLWIFFLISWVGQDYFSPQAMAYALYLACIGLLIRRSVTRSMLAAFVVLVSAIAASHQITPMMLFIAVTALVLLRRTPGWYLPVIAAGITAAWGLIAARSYTLPGLQELVASFGQPVANAGETLDKAIVANTSQLLVVGGGRAVVVVATAVALVGAWRAWRVRGLGLTAVVLMALPAALVVTTGFGGEVLFRAFLFAAPFIAFLAASACLPRDGRGFPIANLVATALLTAVLLPGFLLAYFGKEQQNYFPRDEVAAVAWVHEQARPGSLLVEANRNYPAQLHNYERFTYVAIDLEPEESTGPLLADPARELQGWLSDPRYADAYVLITRGQRLAVDAQQTLPPGALGRIESALRRSPDFRVAHETADATVYALAEEDR